MTASIAVPDLVTPTWDYAPAPEARGLAAIRSSYGLFIGGQFVDPADGASFATFEPSTGQKLAEVAEAGAADVDRAVKAARRAFTRWSKVPGAERGKYLFRIARIIQERSRELAVLESIDNGKPIKETRDVDLPLVAAYFFHNAGWADKLDWAGLGPDPQPLGVAGQVIPWNFPLLMLSWKIARCAGMWQHRRAEAGRDHAAHRAGVRRDLPAGRPAAGLLVNIVTGAGETGRDLVEHPGVAKVAFTGSTAVGKSIARSLAGTGRRLTLELGGKAANVVFEDAPIDQAVEGIVNGIFFNQGHVCCAGSRLLVQESVHDAVVARLKRRLGTLRLGDPLDKNTDIGAINSAEQLERITSLVAAGESEGATMWQPDCRLPERGVVACTHRLHRGVAESPDRS